MPLLCFAFVLACLLDRLLAFFSAWFLRKRGSQIELITAIWLVRSSHVTFLQAKRASGGTQMDSQVNPKGVQQFEVVFKKRYSESLVNLTL